MKSNKQESISRRRTDMWRRYVSLLVAMVLVMGNVLPATSLGAESTCSKTAHTHTAECYTQETTVICGQEAVEGHTHGENCNTETKELICTLEETAGHTHADECYQVTEHTVCGLEAGAGSHKHTDSCYTENITPICTLEENNGHAHTAECYQEVVTEELICGVEASEAHTHTEACYKKISENICGQEEGAGAHTHNPASCYQSEKVLTCGQEETEGHVHAESCMETEKILICGQEEAEAHTHGDACYNITTSNCTLEEAEGHTHTEACTKTENILTCTLEEHIHTENCYSTQAVRTASTMSAAKEKTTKETNAETQAETVKETEASRDEDPVYIGEFIKNVTVESRAVGTEEWKMVAEKVTEKAEALSIADTNELKITIEYKIPGGSLIGTTAVDYELPLKSNEAVLQNKEEVVYALDKVTAIGKAVTEIDGTVTITFDEAVLEANDNGTEITGTYQFQANAGDLTYEEGIASIKFLQAENQPEKAIELNFVEEVETTETTKESETETIGETTEETENETVAETETEAVVENVVTFKVTEGASVTVEDTDVTNATAMAKNGTIYFTVSVEEGYELVSVMVDGTKEARLNPENPEEYIIEGIQTDATIVDVTTKMEESETTEAVVENVVTFEVTEGAQVLVDDTDVTNATAMAKNGTIYFVVNVAEGYELVSVIVDGEKEARLNPENSEEYIIEGIQTDKTVVTVTTEAVETEAAISEAAQAYLDQIAELKVQAEGLDPNAEGFEDQCYIIYEDLMLIVETAAEDYYEDVITADEYAEICNAMVDVQEYMAIEYGFDPYGLVTLEEMTLDIDDIDIEQGQSATIYSTGSTNNVNNLSIQVKDENGESVDGISITSSGSNRTARNIVLTVSSSMAAGTYSVVASWQQGNNTYTTSTFEVTVTKVKVYVYVAAKDLDGNPVSDECLELLDIDRSTLDGNNYFPAGEIEIDASFFDEKGTAADTQGAALIQTKEDWQKVLAALGDLNTTTLIEMESASYSLTDYSLNRGNKVGDYLDQAAGDLGYSWGSQHTALFRWNTSTSYGFEDQTVKYHLDLRFETNKITFITGNNGITSGAAQDGTTVDSRVYITGSEIQEPRNLYIPDGYRFMGYYEDPDFTIPWDGIGTPLNEDQIVYIKITEMANVIIYYENVSGAEAGSLSSDSEGLNPVTGVAKGSTATANEGYEFVGWYADKECTQLLSEEAEYSPTKPENGNWVDGTTYYALFRRQVMDVSVTKNWDDDNDKYGVRPESISVQLLANGSVSGDPVVLNKENNWSYTWEDLPKNGDTGEIAYNVEELGVTGYTSSKTGDAEKGFVITNSINKVKVSFKKTDMNSVPLSGVMFTLVLDEKTSYTLTSDSSGVLKTSEGKSEFELPVNVAPYELTENTAPAGYNKLTANVEVCVKKDNSVTVTMAGTDIIMCEVKGSVDEGYTVIIKNSAGAVLPNTGGTGTTTYTLGGLLMILSAGFFLLYNSKKRGKEGNISN